MVGGGGGCGGAAKGDGGVARCRVREASFRTMQGEAIKDQQAREEFKGSQRDSLDGCGFLVRDVTKDGRGHCLASGASNIPSGELLWEECDVNRLRVEILLRANATRFIFRSH